MPQFSIVQNTQNLLKFTNQSSAHIYNKQLTNSNQESSKTKSQDRSALNLFHSMILLDDIFDQALIYLLRIMISNFISSHPQDSINGLPFELIINLENFSSLKDYCFKSVLLMGEEAQDLAIYLIPVVLRIRVESIMVDKNANDGILIERYYSRTDQTKFTLQDKLNFHNEANDFSQISLFFRPGHYEILISHSFTNTFASFIESFSIFPIDSKYPVLPPQMKPEVIKKEEVKQSENSLEEIKLHCMHTVTLKQLLSSIEIQSKKDSRFPLKTVQKFPPICPFCQFSITYDDFNRIFPKQLTRAQFKKAKKQQIKEEHRFKVNIQEDYFNYRQEEEVYVLINHEDGDQTENTPWTLIERMIQYIGYFQRKAANLIKIR